MNKYQEIITEDALIELANRYIQLEKEFNEYKDIYRFSVQDMERSYNAGKNSNKLNLNNK